MKRKGFTLIELLVVIAIIAILAGMLFPVFARARESARKIQCLSNVKNIAIALQIYLTDYDRFYPNGNGQQNAVQWVNDNEGGCRLECDPTAMNPYLRIPVILDEYVRNRDVWRCPSAKWSQMSMGGMQINPCVPDWFTAFKKVNDAGGCRLTASGQTFPPGWGGVITDSSVQGTCAYGENAFDQSIGNPCMIRAKKMSEMRDVSRTVVVLDAGVNMEGGHTSYYAYPDYTNYDQLLAQCGGDRPGNCASQGYPDCGNAPIAAGCSPPSLCYGGDGQWTKDVSFRKSHARHLGGENLGFADGHAAWIDAERILYGFYDNSRHGMHPQELYGLCDCFNPTDQPRSHFPLPPPDPNSGKL